MVGIVPVIDGRVSRFVSIVIQLLCATPALVGSVRENKNTLAIPRIYVL